jgi:hypothetical protein
MEKVGELETYGGDEEVKKTEKKPLFKRMWDNTIGRKLEEKREMDDIEREAKLEARDQVKEAIKQRIIKEQIEKVNKPKKNPLQSLADELRVIPATDEKMDRLLGKNRGGTNPLDKISNNLGVSGSKFNTDFIGHAPDINPEKVMSGQRFPRAKVENLSLTKDKKGRFDESIRRALGK